MPVGASIAVASVIGAGAQIYSTNKAAKISQNATNTIRGEVQPYTAVGVDALGRISNPNTMMQAFQASPDYQYRRDQAIEGVSQARAVNGLLRSGPALRGVTGVASDMASGEFGNWYNRQSGLAQMGLNAEATSAGALNNNASNQGNAAISVGNTIAGTAGSISDLITRYGGGPAKTNYDAGSSFGHEGAHI